MGAAPRPDNENERLAALRRYTLLDTVPEPEFDRITALAAKLFQVPIALVSLVDADRQWFKSCIGLDYTESARDDAFCAHALFAPTPLIVEDATKDLRFAFNPSVTGKANIRFYAGAPLITREGFTLGTLCIVDRAPRKLTADQIATLVSLSHVVVDLVEARLGFQALREMTALLEAVLDNAGEGIIAADANGHVTLMNHTATQLFDRSDYNEDPTRLRQKYTVLELDNKTVIPHDQTPLAQTLRGITIENHELIIRGTDEVNRYFLTTGRPLIGEDRTLRGGVVTFRDVTMLKEAQNALAALATTDDLTQLPNKRALRERLDHLAREGNRGRKFAVVVTDVDHFKKVNDTHGHKTGDEVLTAVARALRTNIRSTDFVGRYGGEEFVVLYTDVDESIAKGLADKLRLAIAALDRPVKVTASFGVCANFGPFANDASALIKAADEALYRAKYAGRNRVVAYHQPVGMDR